MKNKKTRLREQPGPDKKKHKYFTPSYYHGKHDLQILKKLSAQESGSIVSALALRIAKSLEREQARNGGAFNG